MAIKEKSKNYELDNRTGVNHEGRFANTPARRLTSTSIIGDKVQNNDGEELGKIDNLMINVDNGNVEYVVVEFGSFLGIGGKLFAVPFSELYLDENRRVFILDRDKEYLKECPGFNKDHWPDTNERTIYFGDVNRYWERPADTISII
jgi:sporulation protein YlmC with PRC-barrel domain